MSMDFQTTIKNFLADQGNQQMLQRMGTGAAIGAGGMALTDLIGGGEEDETPGQRAGGLGRSMLLGGVMGGLGGLGYDQIDKNFLQDPTKTPGGANVFNGPGKIWHSIRQMTPDSPWKAMGIGAGVRGGYEGGKQYLMGRAAKDLFGGANGKVDPTSVANFISRTPGRWSDSSAQVIANHLKHVAGASKGAKPGPATLAQVQAALGSEANQPVGGGRAFLGRIGKGVQNTWNTMRAGGSVKNPAGDRMWRSKAIQGTDGPGMTTSRANGMGGGARTGVQNPLMSGLKDMLAKSDFLRNRSSTLQQHVKLPTMYSAGKNSAPTTGMFGVPQSRAHQVHGMIGNPVPGGALRAIGGGALKGGAYGLLAQQAIQQLGRRSFDQLAMTPEAAAELARRPGFSQ